MPVHRTRHAARDVTTAATGCVLTLALAAPGFAGGRRVALRTG